MNAVLEKQHDSNDHRNTRRHREIANDRIDRTADKKESVKETQFHCVLCDKYYASYKSYGNHTRSYHSKNKEKSRCEYCGNLFTRKDNLQQHIKLFHTAQQTVFACPFCGKTFNSRNTCTKHKKLCSYRNIDQSDKLYEDNNNNNTHDHVYKYFNNDDNALPNKTALFNDRQLTNGLQTSTVAGPITLRERETRSNLSLGVDIVRNELSESNRSSYNNDNNNNNNNLEKEQGKYNEKALDCIVCNTTFLSVKDYDLHKPYCQTADSLC